MYLIYQKGTPGVPRRPGVKKFRADQIFHYIYKQNIFSWNDMVLLPKKDREQLKEVLPIYFPEVVSRLDAPDGQTVKLLLQLATVRP